MQLYEKDSVLTYDRFQRHDDIQFNGDSESPIDVYIDKNYMNELKEFRQIIVDVEHLRSWGRETTSLILRKNGKSKN